MALARVYDNRDSVLQVMAFVTELCRVVDGKSRVMIYQGGVIAVLDIGQRQLLR